jgi:hypothetical protein
MNSVCVYGERERESKRERERGEENELTHKIVEAASPKSEEWASRLRTQGRAEVAARL